MNIRKKSVIAGLCLLVVTGIMGIFLVSYVQDILWERTSQQTIQLADKVRYDMDMLLGELDSHLGQLMFNNKIVELLSSEVPMRQEERDRVNQILEQALSDLPRYAAQAGDILVISKNMRILSSSSPEWIGKYRMLGVEWINKIIEAEGASVRITGYSVSKGNSLANSKVMSIARAVQSDGEYQGMVMLDIPMQSLETVFSGVDIGDSGFISVMDEENFVLFSTNTEEIGYRFFLQDAFGPPSFVGMLDNEKIFFVISRSSFSGMAVVVALPYKEAFLPVTRLIRNVIFVIVAAGIGILLISSWLVANISSPILSLSKKMKQVENGNLNVRVQTHRTDEIGILEKVFNDMLEQIQDLIDSEYMANIREREAQLNELTAIINPHFIYNTLETISMNAYLNDDYIVVEMLTRLAKLFRIMTDNKKRYITLEDELAHCMTYLELMKIKAEPPLEVSVSLPEDIKRLYTLKFLIQPLVENSIIHGFADKSFGSIDIDVHADGAMIFITVRDDGNAPPEENLKEVKRLLSSKFDTMDSSHALKNIHDRIQLAFGPEFGVSITTEPSGGTTVQLCLPYLTKAPAGGVI